MGTKTILVVEDNDQMRSLMRHILLKEGYAVIEAPNGVEATQIFGKTSVDLMITDIIMPGKEGFETIIDMKEELPQAKVIAVSGGSMTNPEEYLRSARMLGADITLAKPFTHDQLVDAVRSLLPDTI